MEIIKYEKKPSGTYLVYLSDNRKIKLNEDIILKHKLLYKKEIDESLLTEITKENNDYNIYNKCIKYIGIRLRSTNEIKEYIKKNGASSEILDETIERLEKNRLLDDDAFTKAFINDKLNFTTMGPYRIMEELKHHKIDTAIINKYLNQIDEDKINTKINKQIEKIMKTHKNKPNLKNRIYHSLINLGYDSESILNNLNKYNF